MWLSEHFGDKGICATILADQKPRSHQLARNQAHVRARIAMGPAPRFGLFDDRADVESARELPPNLDEQIPK
jgi:hypothetical protein